MKKFIITMLMGAALSASAFAGVGSSSQTGVFTGEISAIEEGRDSITVVASDGQVRMFEVGEPRKSRLNVGDSVRVSHVDQWHWPLPVRSLTVLRGGYGK